MSRFLRPLVGSAQRSSVALPARPANVSTEHGSARDRLAVDDALLFDALRAWRLERARSDKVSPFIVAYDSVLAEIAERRPQSDDELLAIRGMGPAKVAKFGVEILSVVRGDS
jgi:ATP-dependent DNA helicase RecQ